MSRSSATPTCIARSSYMSRRGSNARCTTTSKKMKRSTSSTVNARSKPVSFPGIHERSGAAIVGTYHPAFLTASRQRKGASSLKPRRTMKTEMYSASNLPETFREWQQNYEDGKTRLKWFEVTRLMSPKQFEKAFRPDDAHHPHRVSGLTLPALLEGVPDHGENVKCYPWQVR